MKKFLSNISVLKRAFVLVAVAFAVIVAGQLGILPQAAAEPPVLPSCNKPLPEGYAQSVQPNVLLLLDTSGSMMYLSERDTSTYGDGSKPYSGQKYFGIDRCKISGDGNTSNNDPNTAYNYHPNLIVIGNANDLKNMGISSPDSYFAKTADGRYLYPNDSRMYKLKLVLWEILNDPGLVSGLRLGLATYYQQKNDSPKVPSVGIYYQWPPTSSGSNQALSWEGSSSWDRALLRRFFKSTDEPGSIEEITKWVDGIETSDNPELRAHGATPLAASIYGADDKKSDARYFFLMDGAINAWCQQNWLIVLTDGADTETSPHDTSPVTAVKNLYNAKDKPEDKWPSFYGNKAQPVKTMVIGLINPTASNVSTLKDTLDKMADAGDDGNEKNNSSHAYFASNVDELMKAFKDIFKQIQSFNSTGNAPLVSPPIGGQEGGIYVPNFVPRLERQWAGHLYKYTLDTNGAMSKLPVWDAGSKLEAKPYNARNVFTVNWKGGNWKMAFDDSNAYALAQMLEPNTSYLPSDQAPKFIRWALGSDEWDEVTGSERYKLGDIYHSGIAEIGPPRGSSPHELYMQFKADNANREKLVYVQANDGMLHAFKAGKKNAEGKIVDDTGEEKWAFIPPNVLAEGRMVGMKQDITVSGNETTVTWLNKEKSNPRYLLDGTMTAEDVLLSDGHYHTVLLGLLGYAGPGLYALDVTDPDKPEFMWAVENAIYNRKGDEVLPNKNEDFIVSYWVKSGNAVTRTDTSHDKVADLSDLNYKSLRFTQSTPAIGYVLVPNGSLPNTWVAIMGNGSQMRINEGFSIASVYVINVENGKLLRVFEKKGPMKQMVTPAAIIWTGSTRLAKYFYIGDDNGIIYEGDLTSSTPSDWLLEPVFDLEGSVGPSYILDTAYIDRNKWIFILTGDYENLMKDDPLKKDDYMVAANISSGASKMNELMKLDPEDVKSVSTSAKGWYTEIPKGEGATTPPVYYNGHIFFSTYVKSEDICSVGTSRIYVLNATTGKGAWSGGKKYVELEGVKVSGIVISEGRVYAGVTDYPQVDAELPEELGEGVEIQSGLLAFDVPEEVANWDSAYPSGVMVPSYWRRWMP